MQEQYQTGRFRIGFTMKMLAITFGLLVVVVAVNYKVFISGYRHSMLYVYEEEAALFTAVANEAKKDTGRKFVDGTIDFDRLVQLTEEEIESGLPHNQTHLFNALPAVVGWHDAENAAKNEGLDFSLITEDPRLPDCAPVHGSFSAELYAELSRNFERDGSTTISRVNEETNTLHFLRIVTVDESELSIYGESSSHGEQSANRNHFGYDVFGFRKEAWQPGDLYGAYEVQHSLDTLDASVWGFFTKGLGLTIPIMAVAAGLFVFLLRRMLTHPLKRIVGIMKDAGQGDFTERLEMKQNDEMGMLAYWFNTLLDNLTGMITEVRSASQSVASASGEIATSAEQMATGLIEQEQQTQQVAAAVEELSKSVSEVAAKSSDATQASESSQHLAEDGGEVVRETVAEMEGIAFEVNASAATVNALGEQSQKIGEIIEVINEIADQTNLLALNAAIEAARAGEHGRGFAVVADEVRKLAERTTQATEEVATSVRGIQNETGSAVEQIESSSGRVGRGVDLASQAGTSLETIVDGSKSVQRMVHDIAAAASQQAAASDEIARSIENISSVTRQSSVGAGQASQAAADLAHQSEHLMCLVDKFKTN